MSVIPKPDILGRLRDEVQHRLPRYLADLETIVNIESGYLARRPFEIRARPSTS